MRFTAVPLCHACGGLKPVEDEIVSLKIVQCSKCDTMTWCREVAPECKPWCGVPQTRAWAAPEHPFERQIFIRNGVMYCSGDCREAARLAEPPRPPCRPHSFTDRYCSLRLNNGGTTLLCADCGMPQIYDVISRDCQPDPEWRATRDRMIARVMPSNMYTVPAADPPPVACRYPTGADDWDCLPDAEKRVYLPVRALGEVLPDCPHRAWSGPIDRWGSPLPGPERCTRCFKCREGG